MFVTINITCFNFKNFWILPTLSTYFSNVSALVMETKLIDYRMGTQFLGAFEKPRKATICFVMPVRLSVRPPTRKELGSHSTDCHEN
jgi:hypothetical protein